MTFEPKAKWEYNSLGIYDPSSDGKLECVFSWLLKEGRDVPGDILEAGSFKGRTLLAFGLFVKQHGLKRKVYGYDTFNGFPPVYHANDDFKLFSDLFDRGAIDLQHLKMIERNQKIKSGLSQSMAASSISSSGDFSDTNIDMIRAKIEFLGLTDIVHLVQGPFSETMQELSLQGPRQLAVASLDCDLYESYRDSLPFIWARASNDAMIFLDEYFSLKFPGARIAVDEFCASLNTSPERLKQEEDGFERWALFKSTT